MEPRLIQEPDETLERAPGVNEPSPHRSCLFCDEPISLRAKVCPHCGRPQRAWKIHHIELTSLINVLVAVGLLVLGAFQYQEAKKDRIEAEQALKKATSVANSVEQIITTQRAEREIINRTFSQLFSDVCAAFDGVFDASSYSCLLPNGKNIKYMPAVNLKLGPPNPAAPTDQKAPLSGR